ncbi:hypothetical protein G7046_g7891 [Stylonectria norvegica]|nr:hypothetical protein G7046_g7891 [Stylonectria norvegica]
MLLGLELTLATAAVVLFGLAYTDGSRSRLWENGGEEGWNSNPNKRIYFYANHKEPPEIPLIWSQRLTDSNLAIAILSFIIFFARATMSRLGYLPRYANVMYDVLLSSLWTISVLGQSSGDRSDAEHWSDHPWYLTRGCAASWSETRGACRVAQIGFGVSMLALVFYGGRALLQTLVMVCCAGRKSEREWTMVDGEEEDEYRDGERERHTAVMLTVQDDRYDQALSPVLAFFPSGPDR